MAEIKSDNPLEIELSKMKAIVSSLEIRFRALSASFQSLPPKERAKQISEFEKSMLSVVAYFSRTSSGQLNNGGAKFRYDTLKQSFQILQHRWRLFQKSI